MYQNEFKQCFGDSKDIGSYSAESCKLERKKCSPWKKNGQSVKHNFEIANTCNA